MRVVLLSALIAVASMAAQDPASADSKQRVKAARAFAKEGSAGVEKLRPLQSDSDVGVRRAAVESLVAIGGEKSLEPLTFSLADGDGEVQRMAAIGLVNFYLPGYYQTGWRGRLKRGTDSVLERFLGADEPVAPEYVTARPEIVAALGKVTAESPSMEARAASARATRFWPRARAASPLAMTATIASPGPSSGVATSSTCRDLRGSLSRDSMPSNIPTSSLRTNAAR